MARQRLYSNGGEYYRHTWISVNDDLRQLLDKQDLEIPDIIQQSIINRLDSQSDNVTFDDLRNATIEELQDGISDGKYELEYVHEEREGIYINSIRVNIVESN